METILVERSPAPSKLEVLGIDEWLLQTLAPGKHSRTHSVAEQCYLIMGELELCQDDTTPILIKRGDLFIIPAPSQVVWNVIRPVEYQYYYLEKNLIPDQS